MAPKWGSKSYRASSKVPGANLEIVDVQGAISLIRHLHCVLTWGRDLERIGHEH